MIHKELNTNWEQCLSALQTQIDSKEFKTWFPSIRPFNYLNDLLTLSVPSSVVAEYISGKYSKELSETVQSYFGPSTKVRFVIAPTNENNVPNTTPTATVKKANIDSELNPELSMDKFVVGNANRMAQTMALSIIKKPGQMAFNPFFLYGASGVGKTHLINAIGLEIVRTMPEKRVLYVPAHLFKTQFMDACTSNKQNEFLHFYQSIDVLIVDDIQEFTTKGTQQAFFHVFNHLQRNFRQIIISSDREPSKIEGFEERMLTRFKAGIMAQIERPDIALRRAIVQTKMRRDGLKFPKECVDYIVNNVESSVRELQGIINSIMAFSVIDSDCEITLELTKRVVARAINLEKRQLNIDTIMQNVCRHFSVTVKEVLSKSRKQAIVQARQLTMFLSHKYTDSSYSEIGRQIGKKDHSTVLHSCDVINNRLNTDKNFRLQVEEVEAKLLT